MKKLKITGIKRKLQIAAFFIYQSIFSICSSAENKK